MPETKSPEVLDKELISAIRNATSREALQAAIRNASSSNSDAVQSAIRSAALKVIDEDKLFMEHKEAEDAKQHPQETILPEITKPIAKKFEPKNKESVTKHAEEAAKTTGKTDISDGAFGESLRAIKTQEDKDKSRAISATRLETLQKVASGEITAPDAKTKKAAEKVAKLDTTKIKKAREIRKARDNFDDLDYALSGVFDETKQKPKALEDVPDAAKPSVAEAEKKPVAESPQREEKPLTIGSLFGGISDDDFEPVAHASSNVKSPQNEPLQASTKEPENSKTETETPKDKSQLQSNSVEHTEHKNPPENSRTQTETAKTPESLPANPPAPTASTPNAAVSVPKQSTEQHTTWVEKVQAAPQPTPEHNPPDPNKMRAIWPPVKANMSPPATPDRKAFTPQQVRNR